MDDERRPIYRSFAFAFIGIALAFVLVDVLERIFGFDFLQGNPAPVALLLGSMGLGLLWTIRKKSE